VLDKLPETSQVWAIDADSVMVRPGPRLVDGVEAIAAMLHGVGAIPEHLLRRVR
jgi:iron complex transport system substrate-binding protein